MKLALVAFSLVSSTFALSASASVLSCSVGDKNLPAVEWQSSKDSRLEKGSIDLGNGVRAEASRHPGYGMYFYNVEIIKGEWEVLASATAWLPDTLGQSQLDHFSAITVRTKLNGERVACSYSPIQVQ